MRSAKDWPHSAMDPAPLCSFATLNKGEDEPTPVQLLLQQCQTIEARPVRPSPETELMYAVLADALTCFEKRWAGNGRRAQRLAREAAEWIFSDDCEWPFSFLNICTALRLDPDYIRLGLRRWRHSPPTPRQRRWRSVNRGKKPLQVAA